MCSFNGIFVLKMIRVHHNYQTAPPLQVSRDQTNLMRPLCGTFPKIHVNNQPAQEAYKRDLLPRAEQLLLFRAEEGSASRGQKERAEARFANRSMVSVFKMTVTQGEAHFQPQENREVHP